MMLLLYFPDFSLVYISFTDVFSWGTFDRRCGATVMSGDEIGLVVVVCIRIVTF